MTYFQTLLVVSALCFVSMLNLGAEGVHDELKFNFAAEQDSIQGDTGAAEAANTEAVTATVALSDQPVAAATAALSDQAVEGEANLRVQVEFQAAKLDYVFLGGGKDAADQSMTDRSDKWKMLQVAKYLIPSLAGKLQNLLTDSKPRIGESEVGPKTAEMFEIMKRTGREGLLLERDQKQYQFPESQTRDEAPRVEGKRHKFAAMVGGAVSFDLKYSCASFKTAGTCNAGFVYNEANTFAFPCVWSRNECNKAEFKLSAYLTTLLQEAFDDEGIFVNSDVADSYSNYVDIAIGMPVG